MLNKLVASTCIYYIVATLVLFNEVDVLYANMVIPCCREHTPAKVLVLLYCVTLRFVEKMEQKLEILQTNYVYNGVLEM